MAALNFPSSPTLNQVYGNYTWDGSKWTITTTQSIDNLSDVTVAGVADNNLLAYNSATSQWTNQTAAQAGVLANSDASVTSATSSGNVVRNITLSTSNPSGGSDGDIWFRYA